jgi:RNA recognition motif-containing protein
MTAMRLFVGNLATDVTPDDLRAVFTPCGPVTSTDVVIDKASGESRGFGFIEMQTAQSAVAAMQRLNGTTLKGRTIIVSKARPRGGRDGRDNSSPGWALVGDGRNRW